MIKPDKSLVPDWDEVNVNHIAEHGLSPEQVEELYYSEGPFPTLAVKQKKKRRKSAIDTVCGGRTRPEPVSNLLWPPTPNTGYGVA